MKKFVRILSVVLVVVLVAAILVSCGATASSGKSGGGKTGGKTGGNGGSGGGSSKGSNLTPSNITYLADIPNYSNASKYSFSTIAYGDTSEQEAKLQKRIDQKQEDIDKGEDVSSITKIFVHSDPAEIIDKMSISGLPAAKMNDTVDYMAGETDVTEEQIDQLVASGSFDKRNTAGWSFFDDYDYYEKLQDRADETKADVDEDNVKRQYRNMAGKVFAIGMTGDEFARFATNELEYATAVTEQMAGGAEISFATTGKDTAYDTYMKTELDYETLVYLRAYNQYRHNNTSGFTDCVELYGYYYDYNRTSYYSQTDEAFEKQLEYGHMDTFTNDQWWEYMTIQRDSYVHAYRYSYSFYTRYYNKHFQFQQVSEAQENFVYGINKWNNKSYTAEMMEAVKNDNFKGQLAMTDWTWCYNGDQEVMNAYNEANTKYQNYKNQGTEKENEGKFYYDIEQLKMVQYLLDKMNVTELAQMLRFQVYSYSSEMTETAQGYKKDIVLISPDIKKKNADEVIGIIAEVANDDTESREYATGKIEAILDQMLNQYTDAAVESNAQGATTVAWKTMLTEVTTAINYDYKGEITEASGEKGIWERRVEKLEDLVIKKVYSCGAEIGDDNCTKTPETPHVECTKEYDKNHKISLFMNNYEKIIRYMAKQLQISYQGHVKANQNQANDYNVTETTTSGNKISRTAGYNGTLDATEVETIKYEEIKSISIDSGKSFAESLKLNENDKSSDDKNWWVGADSKPAKATSNVTTPVNGKEQKYTYVYTFSGWYLDMEYKYLFDVDDELKCDFKLYAGYDLEKTRNS